MPKSKRLSHGILDADFYFQQHKYDEVQRSSWPIIVELSLC